MIQHQLAGTATDVRNVQRVFLFSTFFTSELRPSEVQPPKRLASLGVREASQTSRDVRGHQLAPHYSLARGFSSLWLPTFHAIGQPR